MIRLIRWLFTGDGHSHKWKTIKQEKVVDGKDGAETKLYYAIEYTLQCEHCGNIKSKRI